MATEAPDVETLERGTVHVLYRPRVEHDEARSVEDLQQLVLVLSTRDPERHRLIVVGRKQLPDPEDSGQARNWAFVDLVRKSPNTLAEALQSETYSTKTRGERHRPAARPAGQGVYRIVRHGDHTHLVWALDAPEEPGEVQRDLNLQTTASYIVTVRNPEAPAPRRGGLGRGQRASFPRKLMEKFRGRKFAELHPEFLNHEGAELILVAASEDPCRELDLCLDASGQKTDIFEVLRLDRDEHPVAPLTEGEWA